MSEKGKPKKGVRNDARQDCNANQNDLPLTFFAVATAGFTSRLFASATGSATTGVASGLLLSARDSSAARAAGERAGVGCLGARSLDGVVSSRVFLESGVLDLGWASPAPEAGVPFWVLLD